MPDVYKRQRAARPGSDPADFHFDASKLKLPPDCSRPVAVTMPRRGRDPLKKAG